MLPFLKKFAFILALLPLSAVNGQTMVAATPPMGWNSWDSYGLTITEAEFRANATVLKDKLLPFGYRYAVIDEGWFFENPEARSTPDKLRYALDKFGRYVPVPDRFPSAGKPPAPSHRDDGNSSMKLPATIEDTTFAPIGQWLHAQGLLFGIHIVRGIPRASVERNLPIQGSPFHATDVADTNDACPWDPTNWGIRDNPAGQAWYDSLLRQYAGWGVDLLKVDCISDHPYKAGEIRMIRRAIDKTGRPMVLSLSPGPTSPSHAAEVSTTANMWRISDDFWDVWTTAPGTTFPQSLVGQFVRAAAWSTFDLKPGHWPDLDMLPLGQLRPSPGWGEPRQTRLTADEQRTMLTLWAMNRSPLILGANLTLFDEETLRLLTNRDLLSIDQDAAHRGHPQPGSAGASLQVWTSSLSLKDGHEAKVAAVFNLGDTSASVERSVRELDLLGAAGNGSATVREVWSGRNLGRTASIHLEIPAHGCVLLIAQ